MLTMLRQRPKLQHLARQFPARCILPSVHPYTTSPSPSPPSSDLKAQSNTTASEHKQATRSEPSTSSDFAPTRESPGTNGSLRSTLSDRVPDEYRRRFEAWKKGLEKKGRDVACNAAKNLTFLSLKVNEMTGYREVERLKEAVKEREYDLNARRVEVKSAKHAYEDAVLTRSTTQQSVNALLERKHSWTDKDVADFTNLVRSDHGSRNAVTTTSEDLKQAELAVDKAFTALMQSILERYHEEQVWSDKIRSVSTWASIVALAANLIVFVGAIALVEPWKRRRLVQGLEERISGMMDQVQDELKTLSDRFASLETMPPVNARHDVAPAAAASGLESHAVEYITPSSNANVLQSPIEYLSQQASTSSPQSSLLLWLSAQLSQLQPASIERDLAAAAFVGAIGGALTVGIANLVWGMLRR